MDSEKRQYSCCFFGHRKIDETPALSEKLKQTVESLITDNGVRYFYFGSNSEFDSLCVKVVTALKEKHPHIRRIYVRSAYPDINENYKTYLLKAYDDTYFPLKMRGAGKASYAERNQEMVNQSYYCVIYFDEAYLPPRRKVGKQDLAGYQPKSGTKVTYNYAIKKNCEIINIFTRCE